MAARKLNVARAPGGAPGDWFVDDRCIDCGAARHVAPGLIVEEGGFSVFARQPETPEEVHQAWLAVLVCPTRSVHNEAEHSAPSGLYPHELEAGVFLNGHNSPASFGAHSYFVERASGNLLIDSPVFTKLLVRPFEERGGISKIFLSHRDDVADAEKWARHFGAAVFIHEHDRRAAPFATHVIEGEGPDAPTTIEPGLVAIPVPGHTKGSMVLLVDSATLFTGDSLCHAPSSGGLRAFRNACWYSWPRQKESLAGLSAYSFGRVFPGHGMWTPRTGPEEMRAHLLALVETM